MKRTTLFALIALGLGGVSVAHAQDYSSWYLAPRIGVVAPDSDRDTKASLFSGIGVGVWVNPNFAVDFEFGMNNADFKNNSLRAGHQWENVQLDVAGRYFFGEFGSGWRPYVMGAVGAMRHKAFSGFLLHNGGNGFIGGDTVQGGWDPMASLGLGVQYAMSSRLAFRGEIAARFDRDNNSLNSPLSESFGFDHRKGFLDGVATIGLTYSFGGGGQVVEKHTEQAVTPPPPAQPPREQAVPPQTTAIDLRGVEFKFDHPKVGEKLVPSLKAPTADSVAILDQAVDTLKRYPNARVEVDGHTDSKGTDAYNQKLSERRAHGVYEYLTAHGISSSQISGERGFGESQPIDTNDTAAGRQRNRRVELKVQQ